MEADRAQPVQEALLECAIYLGCKLEPIQMREFTRELLEERLDVEDIVYALRQIRKQPNRKRWGVPLPAEIVQYLRPASDEADDANEIAACIQTCYSRFGYSNADKARAYMGETAWQVVQQSGGWSQMCAGAMEDDKRTEYAQLRDLARASVRRGVQKQRAALLHGHRTSRLAASEAPQLSAQERDANRARASELIESIFKGQPSG